MGVNSVNILLHAFAYMYIFICRNDKPMLDLLSSTVRRINLFTNLNIHLSVCLL